MTYYRENRKAVRQVKNILEEYCTVSGQSVNFHVIWSSSQKGVKFNKKLNFLIFCRYLFRTAFGSYLDFQILIKEEP